MKHRILKTIGTVLIWTVIILANIILRVWLINKVGVNNYLLFFN